jgi:hypothetical protein
MGKPLLWMVIVGVLTLLMWGAARKAERGEAEEQFRGRRAGVARLLSGMGRSLGTTGTMAVGGAAELACVAWLFMAMKKPGDGESQGEKQDE